MATGKFSNHTLLIALLSGTAALGACQKKNTMPTSPDLPGPFEIGETPTEAARRVNETPDPHPGKHAAGSEQPNHAQEGRAQAVLMPTKDSKARGLIQLESQGGRVHLTGNVTGLKPGKHGFHIHETGDCSAPDAKSAGGHFSPEGHPHGGPATEGPHHAGDYGNIEADQEGVAKVDAWSDLPLLQSGTHNVVGRAFVVHEGTDDLRSQPAGDSGARIACGVIVVPGSNPGTATP